MLVNVTVLTKDRARLTEQTLRSLLNTTSPAHPLTVLDDGSSMEQYIDMCQMVAVRGLVSSEKSGGAGIARNKVIRLAEQQGRQDLLYLSDSDCFYSPRWLDILTDVWPTAYALGFRVLGGWSHPYNAQAVNVYPAYSEAAKRTVELRECLAVATQSWLMDWETWDQWGPFDEAPGVRQSEDVAMCNRIRAAGFKVGYVFPFAVHNTSLKDTFGADVPGKELLMVPDGIVME